jgi:hypothetical protein
MGKTVNLSGLFWRDRLAVGLALRKPDWESFDELLDA